MIGASEKRADLVAAAVALLHEQGYRRTTLADVAARARVPLGNVYYHFKTKDALAEAVVTALETELHARFALWSAQPEPVERLRFLARAPLEAADSIIAHGCPFGSLCAELGKLGADAILKQSSERLLAAQIDWAAAQLAGRPDARGVAVDLVGALQGAMLLAHTMRSHELLAEQVQRIEQRLDATLSSRRRKPS